MKCTLLVTVSQLPLIHAPVPAPTPATPGRALAARDSVRAATASVRAEPATPPAARSRRPGRPGNPPAPAPKRPPPPVPVGPLTSRSRARSGTGHQASLTAPQTPPKSAPRRLKSFLEKTLIAHARAVFAARPPTGIAPGRAAQPRPSRTQIIHRRSASAPLALWERVGERVCRAPRHPATPPLRAVPTTLQTPPKKAPPRLKSFLEKTLIAREAPSSTPTRPPPYRAHPAPELTIAARGTSLIRLRSTTGSQVRQRGEGRA